MFSQETYRGFLYFEAVLFMLLGCLAITLPHVFTVGIELLIGTLFLVAGIVQTVRLLQSLGAPGFWSTLLNAVLNLLIGGLLLFYPLAGVVSITYVLIAYFLIEGIIKIYYALQLKPAEKWGWILASGILALLLAFLIFTGLPTIAFWVLGLLVGINMLFFGIVLLAFAMNLSESSN
jgi:uncharacterized membrane protein HdeD (DUF308 family)